MEVVVQFIDGDPDRPLITGAVYNGTHPPPYDLERAESVTRSVIRTQSTPGGDPAKYNELSFQDQAGREEVFVRAQRDLREEVLHDHATHVHAAQSNTVDASQTERIGVDQSVRVHRDRKGVVDRDDDLLVRGDRKGRVLGDDSLAVTGAHKVRIDAREERIVGGEGRVTVVDAMDELSVNGTSTTYARDALQVRSDVSIGHGAPAVLFDGGREVRVQRGDETYVTLDPDGAIVVVAPRLVRLSVGASSVVMKAGSIALDTGAGASVELSGADIKVTAVGEVRINGAMVRLNS
jgi:type VI secretion system secreted protein VgrG